jgi:hypothetical protein
MAGNFTEESATARETRDFWTTFIKDFNIHEKYEPNVIKDDPMAKFNRSQQTDHKRPADSGNANTFLKGLSNQFESNQKASLTNISDDIGTTADSLQASDNGKSDDRCG